MKSIAIALALLFLASPLAAAPGKASKPSLRIRPVAGADSVVIQVGKKAGSYHLATAARPLEFKVDGPTPIRIMTRLLFTGTPPAKAAKYGLVVEIDGVKGKPIIARTVASKRAVRKGGGAVGALKTAVVTIPPGAHRVRLIPAEPGASVAARVLRGDRRPKKTSWVPFTPETYEKVARLHSRDTEAIYYRFSVKTPVTLALNGPVRMRLVTRLDFGQTRGYSQNYAVKTTLDGKPWKVFSYKARASHTGSYPDLAAITPGMPKTAILEVPAGRHQISIGLDCTTAGSASLRILIPQLAIKNGH